MRNERHGEFLAILFGLLLAVFHPLPAGGEENAGAARIEAMANLLAKARRLAVTVDCAYDVLQESAEKIEFGERRELTLRRPDRARFEVKRRDGSQRGIVFDGTQLTVFDLGEKVYAVAQKPGTVDAALSYYAQDLGMRLPLRELFAADLPEQLKGSLASARLVGSEAIGGVETDHVAFRGDTADVQLWIAREGAPLPQRIVITYRLALGQPQFEADFRAWSFDPEVPDTLFTFTPSEGMKEIPILVRGRGRQTDEKKP